MPAVFDASVGDHVNLGLVQAKTELLLLTTPTSISTCTVSRLHSCIKITHENPWLIFMNPSTPLDILPHFLSGRRGVVPVEEGNCNIKILQYRVDTACDPLRGLSHIDYIKKPRVPTNNNPRGICIRSIRKELPLDHLHIMMPFLDV